MNTAGSMPSVALPAKSRRRSSVAKDEGRRSGQPTGRQNAGPGQLAASSRIGVVCDPLVTMNGGDALPRTPRRYPAGGRISPHGGAKRVGSYATIDRSVGYDWGSGAVANGVRAGLGVENE